MTNPTARAGQILIIIAAAFWCLWIFGMAWGIPKIIGCKKRLNGTKEVTVGHGVVAIVCYGLLGIIGGILTLVSKDK